MFFIIALHSQSASGALSRDSSSIYHNNSINNVIAVTNNSTVTDADVVDYMANVILDIDGEAELAAADDEVRRNADADDNAGANNGRLPNRKRRKPIYQNEFAVYIPNGDAFADSIAARHGFANLGQVRAEQIHSTR